MGFEEAGGHALKGDHLPTRTLYRIISINEDALVAGTPDDMTAERWFLRGVSLAGSANQGTLEEAECYKNALRLRESYPEAHNNLAVNLRESGDLNGAAAHYRRALHHRPHYPDAHYNYGLLLERTGSMTGAKGHYEEALRLRGEYAEAHHALANLLKRRSEFERAITHYVEAIRIRPVYPEAHNNFAIALEDTEQFAMAENHYKEALAQQPTYKGAHYNYALLLERLNRSSEPASTTKKLFDSGPITPRLGITSQCSCTWKATSTRLRQSINEPSACARTTPRFITITASSWVPKEMLLKLPAIYDWHANLRPTLRSSTRSSTHRGNRADLSYSLPS